MQERIDMMGTREVRVEFMFLFEIAGRAWATFFGETSMKPGSDSGA
jgi:hypothetical protein